MARCPHHRRQSGPRHDVAHGSRIIAVNSEFRNGRGGYAFADHDPVAVCARSGRSNRLGQALFTCRFSPQSQPSPCRSRHPSERTAHAKRKPTTVTGSPRGVRALRKLVPGAGWWADVRQIVAHRRRRSRGWVRLSNTLGPIRLSSALRAWPVPPEARPSSRELTVRWSEPGLLSPRCGRCQQSHHAGRTGAGNICDQPVPAR